LSTYQFSSPLLYIANNSDYPYLAVSDAGYTTAEALRVRTGLRVGQSATSTAASSTPALIVDGTAVFSGKVGLGTSTPIAQLTILANSTAQSNLLFAIASTSHLNFATTTNTLFSISNTGSTTISGVLNVAGSATSTIHSGLSTPYLNITGTAASSTFANGIDLSGGCFAVNGECIVDTTASSTLLSDNNTWTGLNIFSNATSTLFTATTAWLTNLTATYSSSTALTATSLFASNALITGSTTIGDGTQIGGLTIFGGATTTGHLVVQGTGTSTFASGIALTSGCFLLPSGECAGTGSSGSSGGSSPFAVYATSTVGTTTVQFTGDAGSTPSFSDGILTLPSDTTAFTVELWGSGAGGGSGQLHTTQFGTGGSGGGSGGYAQKLFSSTGTYYVSIGSGGTGGAAVSGGNAAGNDGISGEQSCFGTNAAPCVSATITSGGGSPGIGGSADGRNGGVGGSVSGGDINITGDDGDASSVKSSTVFNGAGGAGGNAPRGGRGGGGGAGAGTTEAGAAGASFGGGGGGGAGDDASPAGAGGDGGAGGLVISIYTSSSNGTIGASTLAGQVPYYAGAATTSLTATSTLFISSASNVGIGTTSPSAKLDISSTLSGSTFDNLFLTNAASATSSASRLSFRAIDILGSGTSTAAITSVLQQNYDVGKGDLVFSTLQSGTLTEALRIDSNGNVGIGTTSPYATLSVKSSETTGNASVFDATTLTSGTGLSIFVDSNNMTTGGRAVTITDTAFDAVVFEVNEFGHTGIRRYGSLDVNTSLEVGTGFDSTVGLAVIANSGSQTGNLQEWRNSSNGVLSAVTPTGALGIGTTTPWRKLSIVDGTASTPQVAVGFDTDNGSQFRSDNVGDLHIGASGSDIYLNNDNLWVCTGGSITTGGCPSGSPSGVGNLIIENKLGIGTTTLGVSNADNAFTIDLVNDSTTDLFAISTSTSDYSSTKSIVKVDSRGWVGIGTSTPSAQLAASGLLYVGGNDASTLGIATSTFVGDIKITGKLDVGTIDPVYTIDGVKYATYGHSTVGIYEETLQTVQLSEKDESGKYAYTINFNTLEKGSDLWLFYQISDFDDGWKGLVVSLTPSFDGRVFYEKNAATNTLKILADQPGEISVRLAAPRFDWTKWPNLRPDQDGDTAGTHVISSK